MLMFYFCTITIAQQNNSYIQVDTVKICELSKSITFIFKIDTSKISLNYYDGYIITTIDIFNMSNGLSAQTIVDTSEMHFGFGGVEYVDVNLDGYLDLDIDLGSFNLTPFHSFWLYDQLKNEFYHSPEFSQLNDYSIDVDEKEIESYSPSTGGRGGYSDKYKIKNGNLFLMKTEYSNYYDYQRQEIVNNVLRTDSLVKTDWVSSVTSVFETYSLLNDSLLLTEKSWLTGVKSPYPDDIYENEIYNCGPWGGCMIYLWKEIYIYGNKKKSYTITDTLRYQVINNKWKKVKTFNK